MEQEKERMVNAQDKLEELLKAKDEEEGENEDWKR